MVDAVPRILVVDDYAHNRLVYHDWLAEIPGVEVLEAAAGARALQLAREHDFAMFLVDINMPDMDGFELASLLRQEPRAQHTPIVFLTSDDAATRHYLLRGYRMGAVDFMVSAPAHGEILAQKARAFVQMFRKRQELQQLAAEANRQNRDLQLQLARFIREHEDLHEQATHDPLTQLPGRALFHDRLCAALARAARTRQRFALAYIDLDGFKAVNDAYGHTVGDALIRAIARRLTESLRTTDTVARLGGDEFSLLLEGLDSTAGAEHAARKVHRLLTAPVALPSPSGAADLHITVGASIGVAVHPDHARGAEDLAMLADLTMYAAKRAGGGTLLFQGEPGMVRRYESRPEVHLVRSR